MTARLPINGIELAVAEHGPADGPVVVLLHGFPELGFSWRHQVGPLADEPAQRLLDQIPALIPGTRAALYDPTGMLVLRSADGIDEATLASLGEEAAKQAAALPDAALLMTHPVRNGETTLHRHIHGANRGFQVAALLEAARTFVSPAPGASPREEANNMRCWLRLDPVNRRANASAGGVNAEISA